MNASEWGGASGSLPPVEWIVSDDDLKKVWEVLRSTPAGSPRPSVETIGAVLTAAGPVLLLEAATAWLVREALNPCTIRWGPTTVKQGRGSGLTCLSQPGLPHDIRTWDAEEMCDACGSYLLASRAAWRARQAVATRRQIEAGR